MDNISSLFTWIFFGDFGLLTMTPRYLFLVLFPIMIFLGIFGQILPHIPFLRKTGPFTNQFFYGFVGLGCTTAALASLDYIRDRSMRSRMVWILVLLIPCSSQLAIIASFAALVTLRVFLVYLFFFIFFSAVLYSLISRFYPLNEGDGQNGKLRNRPPAFRRYPLRVSFRIGNGAGFLRRERRHQHRHVFRRTGLALRHILTPDGTLPPLACRGHGALHPQYSEERFRLRFPPVPGRERRFRRISDDHDTHHADVFGSLFQFHHSLFRQQKLPDACFIWLGSFLALSFRRQSCQQHFFHHRLKRTALQNK